MSLTQLESVTNRLATRGAVLAVWHSPPECFLVGELRWIDSHRLFWFTAHGDREDDGHVLEFDSVEFLAPDRVQFFQQGKRVGLLTDIRGAAVEDPEDYAVAFALWQQVEPRTRPLIERCRSRFEPGRGDD